MIAVIANSMHDYKKFIQDINMYDANQLFYASAKEKLYGMNITHVLDISFNSTRKVEDIKKEAYYRCAVCNSKVTSKLKGLNKLNAALSIELKEVKETWGYKLYKYFNKL